MKTVRNTLARWVGQIALEHVADAELLRRFLQDRDQAAFELLVHRYGSMVLGLCRRLLGQMADAEDAFQATFMTLAHQARRIKKQQSLGSWLYKVAWRMCQRQRRRRPLRVFHLDSAARSDASAQDMEQREISELLAREVDRLSDCLRAVVVLCCLRNLSPKEAAVELGCPANTVVVRLRRARELLKKRLKQRGYFLSTGIAATLGMTSNAAQLGMLAVPLSHAALQISLQGLSSGLLSPTVTCLLKGAVLNMWLKPIQLTTLAVLSLGLVTLPFWSGGTPVQAQPPGQAVHRYPFVLTQEYSPRWLDAREDVPFPQDENLPEEAKKWIDELKKQEDVIRKEAEQKMRGMRMVLHGKLKQLQDTYTRAGDLDRALALRDQVRRLELAIASAFSYESHSGLITQHRGQNGKTLVFSVRGRLGGSVWGDGIYTDDSNLSSAAVHAGLLQPGQSGLIKVTIMPGRDAYTASTRNGVTTSPYQGYPGSIRIEKADLDADSK